MAGSLASAGDAASTGQGFTITGTVATGISVSGVGVTFTDASGNTLGVSTTTRADGSYTATTAADTTYPITINAGGLSTIAASELIPTRNINPITTAVTETVLGTGRSLSSVSESDVSSAGDTIVSSVFGGGLSYETFSTASFTARTDVNDYTKTASVADVLLDSLSELAANSGGSSLSNFLNTQVTAVTAGTAQPLMDTQSFQVELSSNLALIPTTQSITEVASGDSANAVSAITAALETVIGATGGTSDRAAVAAVKGVGEAMKSAVAEGSTLTSTEFSTLAINTVNIVSESIVSVVTSEAAGSLSQSDLSEVAAIAGKQSGFVVSQLDLTTRVLTPTQIATDLTAVTVSITSIRVAVEGIASEVASGTSVADATANSGALTTAVAEGVTATGDATDNTGVRPTTVPTVVVVTVPDVDPIPTSPVTPG